MKLHALDIPEDTFELIRWLERHLCGLTLGELVSQLAAVHADSEQVSLDDILGSHASAVLDQGLAVLPSDRVRRLLVNPQRLLELQERVLRDGGRYWDHIQADRDLDAYVSRGRVNLPTRTDLSPAKQVKPLVNPRVLISLATAATLLAAFFGYGWLTSTSQETVAWGWNNAKLLDANAAASEYLNGLADAADEWKKQRPTTATDLAKRIAEFRQGCSMLLLAEHKPLDLADKKWLLDQCRTWADQLDDRLRDVENEARLDTVRRQIDQLVASITTTLRTRATEIA